MELPLDSRNIREDVSMIELKIVQDRGFGAIVDKLGALVEKCRVVFVGLDHEKRGIREPRRYGKIAGHATDQEPRFEPGPFQHPGQHRRGSRLAMRSRYSEHPLT